MQITIGPGRRASAQTAKSKTVHDHARIADAEARRVRRGWKRANDYRATWARYHPLLNR